MKTVILFILFGLFAYNNAQDCVIFVPASPLTATGLATPWALQAPCTAIMGAAFVESTILDTTLGKIYVYSPLVITAGLKPLVVPTAPVLPTSNSVGIFIGSNGCTLTLADNKNGANLLAGACVNGLPGSIFGQVSFCNGVAFFAAANLAINNKQLVVAPLGTAVDGLPCPTVRDFFLIDMDQSDNVVTAYIAVGNLTAQDTTANRNNNPTFMVITNGSDNRLLSVAMDGAMGCTPFMAPDLSDAANTIGVPSQALNELSGLVNQASPIALVPLSHVMCRVNNQPSLAKTNAYRGSVGQVLAVTNNDADGVVYCTNMYYTAPKRMAANQAVLFNAQSADPNVATNLFAFLAQRYFASFGPNGLNCASLLNVAEPIVPIMNGGGLFVGATITVPVQPGTTGTTTGLSSTTIIIIVVCTVGGALLLVGLIVGVIFYRRRAMYS